MDRGHAERAARTLLDQHRAKADYATLSGDLAPADLADATAIQEALIDIATGAGNRALAGWKIALTTPVMQALVGVDHPCPGAVFADRVLRSPAEVRAADYVRLAVEAEIAVRIGRDAGPDGAPYDRESMAGCVAACMPAIEIVDDRNWDYEHADARDLVADNSFNFGCVLGPEREHWRDLDLAAVAGRMAINAATAGEGRGGDVLGHPFVALAWLANHLLDRGRWLRAGDVVLTGSVVATKWPAAGDVITAEMDGLGAATLRVA